MKRITAIIGILSLFLSVSVYSGELLKKTIEISSIDSVELQGPGLLVISQDGTERLEIIANSNVMSHIEVNARGTTLRLRLKDTKGWGFFNFDNKIRYKLSLKKLNQLKSKGSSDIELATVLTTDKLRLDSAGSGNMSFMDINAKEIKMASAGSGDFNANTISADEVDISFAGSGNITVHNFNVVERIEMDTAGSGDIHVKKLNSNILDITMAGSSDATIDGGQVANQRVEMGGAGDYTAPQLKSTRAQLDLSGSADASVWVTDILEINASGASDVQYYGQPLIKADTSGASDVKSLGNKPN